MATYALIGDIHGNLEALQAVLLHLDRERVDHILALGDLVGYNASSNECIQLIRERGIDCIYGNHDLIAQGRLGFDRCAMRPEFTLRRTRRELDLHSRRFLATLPPLRVYEDGIVLIHGGVDDVTEYLRTPGDIARNALALRRRVPRARLCFHGHTHVPRIYEVGGAVIARTIGDGPTALDPGRLSFVNPGSVDAARRPEKLAELAIFDSDRWTVKHQRIPYDDARAEQRAAEAHYRMTRVDEAVFGARRLVRRGGRKAARLVNAVLAAARPDPFPTSGSETSERARSDQNRSGGIAGGRGGQHDDASAQ